MISLIVAVSRNNVIGRDGGLPWHLSDDLRRFKALTMGKPVVMGRKTFESIGHALPGRQNIVISTQPAYPADGCDVVGSPAAAVAAAGVAEEVMVIGGGEIYRLMLSRAERVYRTEVDVDTEGDTLFPELDPVGWIETSRVEHEADAANDHAYAFVVLEKSA